MMVGAASTGIREVIEASLRERGIMMVSDHDALFSTGLLDSLAATEVLVALEADYGIDLADEDFDVLEIDTLHGIEQLIVARRSVPLVAHETE
jgi:acyl carrier protein